MNWLKIKVNAEELEVPNINRWYTRGMGIDTIKNKLIEEYGYDEEKASKLINSIIYEEASLDKQSGERFNTILISWKDLKKVVPINEVIKNVQKYVNVEDLPGAQEELIEFGEFLERWKNIGATEVTATNFDEIIPLWGGKQSSINKQSDTTVNIDNINVSDNSTVKFKFKDKFKGVPEISEGDEINMTREKEERYKEKKKKESFIVIGEEIVQFKELKRGDKFAFLETPETIYIVSQYDPLKNEVHVALDEQIFKYSLKEFGDVDIKKVATIETEEFELWDRVRLLTNGIEGTLIETNKDKPGDTDLLIKWDTKVAGEEITEVHPTEVNKIGKVEDEKEIEKLQKVREKFLEEKIKYQEDFDKQIEKEVKEEMDATKEERLMILNYLYNDPNVEAVLSKISSLGEDIEDYYQEIFDVLERSASVNYPELLPDLRKNRMAYIGLVEGKMKQSSLNKESYIKKVDNKWIVYSESGKELGKHDTEKEAVAQLQAIEISKHKK